MRGEWQGVVGWWFSWGCSFMGLPMRVLDSVLLWFSGVVNGFFEGFMRVL